MASRTEEEAVLESAITGRPRDASSEAGILPGYAANATGGLHDGWQQTGGQAGVQLNLKHARGQNKYVDDSASRGSASTANQTVTRTAIGGPNAKGQAGTTAPRGVGPKMSGGGRVIAN